ncbi:helix-turn-helix domain-containing protein [Microcystis sp. M061S2]|uniref:helix-turn-helix domain-containing protein n=1 Tax=Microcystis sp. M061S2 TaxID=2771171 RepID=UPI0025886E3B|nr:helix-turn-helix domain-containing protein [Microcystis sp. M061S2]MCA2656373.1 helix-turn-helix domain-containing protein [Microcystis sp. M061S2]
MAVALETEKEIVELYRKGTNIKDIAGLYKMGRQTIRNILEKNKVEIRGRWMNFPNVQKALAKPRGKFAHLK